MSKNDDIYNRIFRLEQIINSLTWELGYEVIKRNYGTTGIRSNPHYETYGVAKVEVPPQEFKAENLVKLPDGLKVEGK